MNLRSSNSPSFLSSRAPFVWIGALFLVVAFARCWTNLPWCDEGWFFNPVYTLLTKGFAGTTTMDGAGFPWDGVERYQYWQTPFHLVLHGIWLKIFGLNLVSFRSLSVVAGGCWLVCWMILLRHFGTPRPIVLLALVLIATDYASLRTASDGRTDMLAAAFGLAAVTAYLRWRERNFTVAVLLSQTLVVCGGLTHPMGGLPYLGFLAYFFIRERDWKQVRVFHVALAALPYILGIAGWGAYILQDPQLFKKIFFGSSTHGRLNGFLNPLLALRNEFVVRYLEPFGLRSSSWIVRSKLVIPIVYLAGAVAVLCTAPVRRIPHLRPVLAMLGVAFLVLLFLDNQRNGTYMVHIFPMYAIALASWMFWAWQSKPAARPLLALFGTGFLLLQLGGSLYLIFTNPYRHQFQSVTEYVRKHSNAGDRIVGSPELGFGLGFDNIHDDKALGYYYQGIRPDVIILTPRYQAWYDSLGPADADLRRYISRRMQEFAPVFGTQAFQVYLPKTAAARAE